MSRTHAHHQRRRSKKPKLRGVSFLTWGEAMERVEECYCSLVVVPGPVMVVTHRHRHGCHALERWNGKE